MRGELSSAKFAKRHPLDWYVDEPWCARQLFEHFRGFADDKAQGLAIWDPSAGLGNTIDTFIGEGFDIYLSDVVENVDWPARDPAQWSPPLSKGELGKYRAPRFFPADFLEVEEAPAPCSIVCNPPYSYRKVQGVAIAELFARHALRLATGRVCLLLPNKWLSSQTRHRLFMRDHPPAMVLHLTQRPSMPPGDRIHLMGSRAFRGGMVDYCWIVWDLRNPTLPGDTRTIWLPPLGES